MQGFIETGHSYLKKFIIKIKSITSLVNISINYFIDEILDIKVIKLLNKYKYEPLDSS